MHPEVLTHIWNLVSRNPSLSLQNYIRPLVTVLWLYIRLTGQVVLLPSTEESLFHPGDSIYARAELISFCEKLKCCLPTKPSAVLCMPIKALTTNSFANLAWLGINSEIPLICPANRQKKMSLANRIPSLIRFLLVKTGQKCATNCCWRSKQRQDPSFSHSCFIRQTAVFSKNEQILWIKSFF